MMNEAFKHWFGRSRVVDEQGKPRVVYHGTGADISKFDPLSHFGTVKAAHARLEEREGWDPAARNGEHNSNVMPVHLRIENPLRVTDAEASRSDDFLNAVKRRKYPGVAYNTAARQGIHRALLDAGYDGMVYRNRIEDKGQDSYVITHPEQVKSAIGNSGDYSGHPDITRASGGRAAFKIGGAPDELEPGSTEPDEALDPNRAGSEGRLADIIKRGQPIQPRTPPPGALQLAAARADTRVGGDIVNKRLDTIVPEHTRVAGGTYSPGAPGGRRWADAVIRKEYKQPIDQPGQDPFRIRDPHETQTHHVLEKLSDQPGAGFKVTDPELDKIWHEAVGESSQAAKNAVQKHNVRPTFDAKDWHQAMSLPLRDHLWYELSGEKMAENLPDLTPKEHMRMLDILGATSARAKPDENLERTLAAMSQHLRKAPMDVDLTIPSTVRQALGREGSDTSALPGNKTGHFSDTLALAGGVPTRFPISVNDVWVGRMFGVPDQVMSSNQSLHEPMSIYFNKLRDLYNERHKDDRHFPYQSWNFQAPAWVHLRNKESGASSGDAYHQVWGKTLQKVRDAGVPGIHGDKITREALMHPGFADALRRTVKPYRDAPKATVEFGTTQTKTGKQAAETYQRAQEAGDKVGQQQYLSGLTSAMYGSARGKLHPWDRLKKAITGDVTGSSDITRIAAPTSDAPLDIGSTFEGNVSPNIRVPLKGMDDDQLAMFNAIAGRHLKQDAMAVSHILGAEHGSEPRKDYTRGHSLFVPTTEQIHPGDIRSFAKELAPHGHNMSYQRHPNGYQFDVLPSFGDTGPVGVPEHLLDEAYGKTLHGRYGKAHITPHDFKSVYTEAGDYGKLRTKLTERIRKEYVDQAAEHGIKGSHALAALKAPPPDFPSGGKKARDVYRTRLDHLAASEQAFKEIAGNVEKAHKAFHEKTGPRLEQMARRVPHPDAAPFARGGTVNHEPTEAQKIAGNYAKEHNSFQGLPISIENKKGSTRSGVDEKGKAWSCELPADYGYIKRTKGADGDHVDVYIGSHHDSPLVVLINQHRLKGRFDEHKVMLGFTSEREALSCYKAAFSDGKGAERIGSVEVMSVDAFKHWLKTGRTTKAANGYAIVDRAARAFKDGGAVLATPDILQQAHGILSGLQFGKPKDEPAPEPVKSASPQPDEVKSLVSAVQDLVATMNAPVDAIKDKNGRITGFQRRIPGA